MQFIVPIRVRHLCLLGLTGLGLAAREPAPAGRPPDAPWKIHQTTPPAFPLRLMRRGVAHGEACVRVSIAKSGELLDALVTACSERDFGDEALHRIREWRYEPARENGEAIGVVADVLFSFDVNGPIAIEQRPPSPRDAADDRPGDRQAYRAADTKSLDRIPQPVQIVAPSYPQEWAELGISGAAMVDFYIDETGRARVPVAVSADHVFLGAIAVAAVAQWRFAPPTVRGQPVLVHAQQLFTFQSPPKAAVNTRAPH